MHLKIFREKSWGSVNPRCLSGLSLRRLLEHLLQETTDRRGNNPPIKYGNLEKRNKDKYKQVNFIIKDKVSYEHFVTTELPCTQWNSFLSQNWGYYFFHCSSFPNLLSHLFMRDHEFAQNRMRFKIDRTKLYYGICRVLQVLTCKICHKCCFYSIYKTPKKPSLIILNIN